MKTLSVRQPWVHLICSGLKDVENRSRRTKYQGKILIHSPAKFDDRGMEDCFNCKQIRAIVDYFERTHDKFWDGEDYKLSTIIGSVEIIDCINNSESIWAEPGQWHWLLKNPVLFDKPILNVKGMLGLWNYEEIKT